MTSGEETAFDNAATLHKAANTGNQLHEDLKKEMGVYYDRREETEWHRLGVEGRRRRRADSRLTRFEQQHIDAIETKSMDKTQESATQRSVPP